MKIQMRGHKQDYFIILLAAILVIVVFSIVYISFTRKPVPIVKPFPNPTTAPSEIQTSSPLPVLYDNAAQSRLAKIITQRPTLSQADAQQKSVMLNTILHGSNSGVLYETAHVRIEYVDSADMLMAEIKTSDIVKAKAEVTDWLLNQGFSQDGICKLPVMFYLDPEVRDGLQGQSVIFSPLPNNC